MVSTMQAVVDDFIEHMIFIPIRVYFGYVNNFLDTASEHQLFKALLINPPSVGMSDF